MLLKTLAVLQGCSGLLRSAATLLVPAFLLAVPAAAGPFVVNIYLAEDNFTTGFIAPGKISVSVAPVRMYSGQLVMCEFALNDTGKGCKGNIISDVVTFDDVTTGPSFLAFDTLDARSACRSARRSAKATR
jgi:hypothetical protein